MSENEYIEQRYAEMAYWSAVEKELWEERERRHEEAMNDEYYSMVTQALGDLLALAYAGIKTKYDKDTDSILIMAKEHGTSIPVIPNTQRMIRRVFAVVNEWYSLSGQKENL